MSSVGCHDCYPHPKHGSGKCEACDCLTDSAMRVYLWETKTTSEDISRGSTFWKRTTLDPQVSLYIPALEALGYEPLGCIYDVLRKPQHRPSSKGETPESYGVRCLAAIAEDPDRYYARGIVVRLQDEGEDAAKDIWNTAGQMRDAKRLNVWPRNPDACIVWNRECDYLNVCARMATIDDPVLFQYEAAHVELDADGSPSDDLSLLTQSSMRSYRSCPRKFYYRYMVRRRPLKKAGTLVTGTSVHGALETYRRTGDLDAARRSLSTEDPFVRAKESAMVTGYAARWGVPTGVVAVERQFRLPLVNPETGAASRTFTLGGRVDAIVSEDEAIKLTRGDGLAEQLQASLEKAHADRSEENH